MSTPKKRRVITLAVKKSIIEAAEKECKKTKLAKQFGMAMSCLSGILKEKNAVLEAIDDGSQAKHARLRAEKHDQMEEALVKWLKQIRSQNVPVSGDLLKEKALAIASCLKIVDFKASEGWMTKFKDRLGIRFKAEQGEAGAVDVGSLREWQQDVLLEALAQYSADDIFNTDETGLFWEHLPNRTMAMRGDTCAGGKKRKERITVLVCANMSGTEKLPLLVIGKSAKPRCLKNEKVPVEYEASRKAWMTGIFVAWITLANTCALFEAHLKKWDKKLKNTNRKVLLYLDNCSAHPNTLKIDNINIKFFPPNTTAASQPMDQGVIKNLKVHYRKLLPRRRIAQIEGGMDYKLKLLDALHLLRRAWGQVTVETTKNCFRHANFIHKESPNEEQGCSIDGLLSDDGLGGDGVDDFVDSWNGLQELGGISEEAIMEDFINLDNLMITCGELSLAEILEDVSATEEKSNRVSDSEAMNVEEVEVEQQPISRLEAQRAFVIVRQYLEQNSADSVVLSHSDAMDDYFYEERRKKQMQAKITHFFLSDC